MRGNLIGLGLLFLGLLPVAKPSQAGSEGKRWAERVKQAEASLRAGDYARVRQTTLAIAQEMMDRLGPSEGADYALGVVVLLRALAEAGLGHGDEALWYWHVALNLHPPFADMDLERFGDSWRLLQESPLPPPRDPLLSTPCVVGKSREGRRRFAHLPVCERDVEVEAPRVRRRAPPRYPEGAKSFQVTGLLVVEAVIRSDGRVASPLVLEAPPVPTLTYAALEALRTWEFEPARQDGAPVDSFYTLTLNFDLSPP